MTDLKLSRAQVAAEAKKAQDIVSSVLQSLGKTKGLVYERIPDSKSAGFGRGGNLITGRRGDFDGIVNGQYFILEVKNSMRHTSFKGINIKSTFQPAQLSAAHNWGKEGAVCLSVLRNVNGAFNVVRTNYLVQCLSLGKASCDVPGVALSNKQALADYLCVELRL